MRLGLIESVRSYFACPSREKAITWHYYGALCIKDFHIDLGSLMDSIAPVIIQVCGIVGIQKKVKLLGFTDIQRSGSPRAAKFRSQLPEGIRAIIDTTDQWWPSVKAIRDILAHREHQKVAFGSLTDGVLFQIYEPLFSPKVIHKAFLWPHGHHVADFRRYSAYIIVEVLLFFDVLGTA